MGKLIQFPVARRLRRPRASAGVFTAFGELEHLERAQLRLFIACGAGALLLTLALQLASL